MRLQLLMFAAMGCSATFAQRAGPPSFEVASIRVSDPGDKRTVLGVFPGSLTIVNMPLKNIVQWAYDVQSVQIHAPGWFDDTRFSITARAEGAANEDRLRLMLRSLLEDRFAMTLRHERKEVPTYALTVSKNGPRFHEQGPKDASKFMESTTQGDSSFKREKTGLVAERARMSGMAEKLSEPLRRPVIDKTGLTGRYDIRIDITAYLMELAGDGGGRGENQQLDPMALIFSALQGQLGLKVEPSRDLVDFLVIDSASKTPSEN